MKIDIFNRLVDSELGYCSQLLIRKGREYAPGEDRLQAFKDAAAISGNTPKQALWGMLTKHLVSIKTMVNSTVDYDMDLWNEKITDSINYLILLKTLVIDEKCEEEGYGQDTSQSAESSGN